MWRQPCSNPEPAKDNMEAALTVPQPPPERAQDDGKAQGARAALTPFPLAYQAHGDDATSVQRTRRSQGTHGCAANSGAPKIDTGGRRARVAPRFLPCAIIGTTSATAANGAAPSSGAVTRRPSCRQTCFGAVLTSWPTSNRRCPCGVGHHRRVWSCTQLGGECIPWCTKAHDGKGMGRRSMGRGA